MCIYVVTGMEKRGKGRELGRGRPSSRICRRTDTGDSFIRRMVACVLNPMGKADEVRLQMR